MAQGDRDPPGDGPEMPRAAFDVVARGFDPEQVDGYVRVLWRYCADLTARVAAAEAALRHERDRRAADDLTDPTQSGQRIGRMLAIAQQMADEIIGGARLTAEQTLYEAVRDAGAAHPIAQEAREQADKLLADATAEARRLARERHQDLEAQIHDATTSLEVVRRQQGELLGALLRLRGMVGGGDFERTVAVLARAGAQARPPAGDATDTAAPSPTAAPTGEPKPSSPPVDVPTQGSPSAAGPLPRRKPGGPPADGAPLRPARPGAEVLDGELYPVEADPVSPPGGPARAAGDEIIDVEVVSDAEPRR